MASLSELYSSLDTLKGLGLDVQELQEKIEQKENEVLSSEVIPSLEEIVNILLQSFRKDVKIVIEHRAGSKINSTTSNSFNRKDAYRDITNNYCNLENGLYVLKENYTFASPSTASSVVLGRSSNGWIDWKDEQGNCLNTIYPR